MGSKMNSLTKKKRFSSLNKFLVIEPHKRKNSLNDSNYLKLIIFVLGACLPWLPKCLPTHLETCALEGTQFQKVTMLG